MTLKRRVSIVVWAALNICGSAFFAFLIFVVTSMKYDEMHTSGTAMDPIYNLTRATVVKNIFFQSLSVSLWVAPLVVVFWLLNYGFWCDNSENKKIALGNSLMSLLILISGLAASAIICLSKYPQTF